MFEMQKRTIRLSCVPHTTRASRSRRIVWLRTRRNVRTPSATRRSMSSSASETRRTRSPNSTSSTAQSPALLKHWCPATLLPYTQAAEAEAEAEHQDRPAYAGGVSELVPHRRLLRSALRNAAWPQRLPANGQDAGCHCAACNGLSHRLPRAPGE
eukprot:5349872-Prymnesium_polylepis.1